MHRHALLSRVSRPRAAPRQAARWCQSFPRCCGWGKQSKATRPPPCHFSQCHVLPQVYHHLRIKSLILRIITPYEPLPRIQVNAQVETRFPSCSTLVIHVSLENQRKESVRLICGLDPGLGVLLLLPPRGPPCLQGEESCEGRDVASATITTRSCCMRDPGSPPVPGAWGEKKRPTVCPRDSAGACPRPPQSPSTRGRTVSPASTLLLDSMATFHANCVL